MRMRIWIFLMNTRWEWIVSPTIWSLMKMKRWRRIPTRSYWETLSSLQTTPRWKRNGKRKSAHWYLSDLGHVRPVCLNGPTPRTPPSSHSPGPRSPRQVPLPGSLPGSLPGPLLCWRDQSLPWSPLSLTRQLLRPATTRSVKGATVVPASVWHWVGTI